MSADQDEYGAFFDLNEDPEWLPDDMDNEDPEWLPDKDDENNSTDSFGSNLENEAGVSKNNGGRKIDAVNANLDVDTFLDGAKSKNSKKAETNAVKLFNETMVTLNKTKKFTFKSIETCPLDELGNQLSHFFMVVSKSDGSTLNASSLKAYHIALARYLNQRRTNSVDIKKDSRFRDVAAVLKARCTEAASKGERPGKNKANPVPVDKMAAAFAGGHLGRKTPRALISTVHYNMIGGFGCRALQVSLSQLVLCI